MIQPIFSFLYSSSERFVFVCQDYAVGLFNLLNLHREKNSYIHNCICVQRCVHSLRLRNIHYPEYYHILRVLNGN